MTRPRGRPEINLDQFKTELTQLFEEGLTYDQIAQYLLEEQGVKVNIRTIKRRFQLWGVIRRTPPAVEELAKLRIQVLFFEVGLNDNEILIVLRAEGIYIKKSTLVRLRFELGLRRRIDGEEAQLEAERRVRELVSHELEKGTIDGYGRRYLYTHFRQQGHIIARDRLFQVYRTLNSEAVERRKRDFQRHRGEYIVPGPNFVWSVDGYAKLKPYGIEIYACIDAYSRYIVWVYVGISGCTAVSCLRQFLETLEAIGKQPRFVRSDRGTETVMLGDAHYQLQRTYEPDLEFQQCYLYGTSTANQRIESWWLQLSKGLLFRWRNFFSSLRTQGLFSKDNLADQIGLLAIYIPVLRTEISNFVRLWNCHNIRKQHNRPNAVIGKPFMLYNHPGSHVKDWSVEFDPDQLRTIKATVQDWDLDGYLPPETLEFCSSVLESIGFNPQNMNRTEPFLEEYKTLRTSVSFHIQNQFTPILSILAAPTGSYNWQGNSTVVREVDFETDLLDEFTGDLNLA